MKFTTINNGDESTFAEIEYGYSIVVLHMWRFIGDKICNLNYQFQKDHIRLWPKTIIEFVNTFEADMINPEFPEYEYLLKEIYDTVMDPQG